MPILGRPGIHETAEKNGDKTEVNKDEEINKNIEEIPYQCRKCHSYYIKSKTGFGKKCSEEELKKWLAMKKSNIYPNLSKVHSYVCQVCSGLTQEGASLDGTDSVNGSHFSIKVLFLGGFILTIAMVTAIPHAFEYGQPREVPFEVYTNKQTDLEIDLDNRLDDLEQKYPAQEENVWYTLGAGIKYVARNDPNRPSVFLFLYDSESAGNTAKCLAKDASHLASLFLKSSARTTPVILSGVDLNKAHLIEDSGRMLVDYNDTVRNSGAMVVTNLQDVPAEVAKILHFFCDAYSPLVETAIYIFTLKVDNIPNHKKTETAREKLIELWSNDMPGGTIQALITRITPNVLGIKSDIANC